MKRREAREILLQIIFQLDIQKDYSDSILESVTRDIKIPQRQMEYISDTYHRYVEHHSDIDELIDKYSEKWRVNHLPKSELAIIRLATTEIMYCDDIPDAVSINEAVELGKSYGQQNAWSYINGVLGKIAKTK